jgi:hypothetical protein
MKERGLEGLSLIKHCGSATETVKQHIFQISDITLERSKFPNPFIPLLSTPFSDASPAHHFFI